MTTDVTTNDSRIFSYSLEDIAALRDLFKTLANGAKAVNQYPAHHPIPVGFKEVFQEKLDRFFERNDEAAVEITATGIVCGVDEIMSAEADQENIPAILHRDGVRQLRLSSEIKQMEIEELFDCLARCCGPEGKQHDVVNLFWQAQFEAITYEAVDLFAINEINLPEGVKQQNFTAGTRQELSLDQQRRRQERDSLQQQMMARFGRVSDFSEEEIVALQEDIDRDAQVDIRAEATNLLMQVYASAESLQDQAAAIERLKAILDKCIELGRFSTLCDVVRQGKKLLQEFQGSPARKRGLSGFLLRCGDSIRLRMVTERLNEDEQLDLEPVREFLSQLGPDSLNNLIAMLGDLAHYPARRMLCDLLVAQGFERIDIIGSGVFDSRWYLVRNVVWVLGETGSQQVLAFLRRASAHTDERVRAEVVKALGKIRHDESVKLLLSMLDDKAERISTMAANELGRTRSPLAFAALQSKVTDKNFQRQSLTRIRQLLTALVACDGSRALETIRSLLKQTVLIGRGRLRQVQETAVNALQSCDDPRAQEFLGLLSEDRKSSLSTVARKALRQQRYQLERSSNDSN